MESGGGVGLSFVIGGILGWQVGLMILIVYPALIAPMMGPGHRAKIANIYYHMSMFSLGRALHVRRTHGGVDLINSSFSGKRDGEKMKIGGETKVIEDTHNFLRTFKNKPFGLFYEGVNCIVDPAISEIAYAKKQQHVNDEHTRVDPVFATDDNPEGEMFTSYVEIPKERSLVDIAHGADILHGSAAPSASQTAYVWGQKSQELFDRFDNFERIMMILMAFGAGYGFTWFGLDQAGGSSGLPNPIPMGSMIDPTPVVDFLITGVL